MAVAVLVALSLGLFVAVLIYPGELSHLSPRFNKWLYDRAASNYQEKWRSRYFEDPRYSSSISNFTRQACSDSGVNRVLDLGCGTGRGIRLTMGALDPGAEYTGIDFSGPMLEIFRNWLADQDPSLSSKVTLIEDDLQNWAQNTGEPNVYGVVMMLEVGEFLPQFETVLTNAANCVSEGGGLILTRPAGLWWLFFPGRHQSRKALSRLLLSLRFAPPEFMAWRSRYELVFVRKLAI